MKTPEEALLLIHGALQRFGAKPFPPAMAPVMPDVSALVDDIIFALKETGEFEVYDGWEPKT